MPLIIAHRGASFDAPENTFAAFRLAFEQGADGIECDFRMSADGQIVCCHDATTRRCGDRDLVVGDSGWEALRTVDVGAWKGPAFAGERMPTLAGVLGELPRGKLAFLELKAATPAMIDAVAVIVRRSGVEPGALCLMAFDLTVVLSLRRVIPEVAATWLVEYGPSADSSGALRPPTVLTTVREHGISHVGSEADPAVLTPAVAEEMRADGRSLHVWTVDSREKARPFVRMGVASITTNRPGLLRAGLGGEK